MTENKYDGFDIQDVEEESREPKKDPAQEARERKVKFEKSYPCYMTYRGDGNKACQICEVKSSCKARTKMARGG